MSNSASATTIALDKYRQTIESIPTKLYRHREQSMSAILSSLASAASQWPAPDYYGSGDLINNFESEIAALFGKQGGLFMPSGTMAQAMALRMVANQKRNPMVAMHASSHLLLHEQAGYEHLWQLQPQLIGDINQPILASDLATLETLPSAVLTEIPARETGGLIPEWDDLQAQARWAKENDVNFHLDGARIWSCAEVYGKSFSQIGELFDVIYLSFYKDLDGISGAMLLADSSFIDLARVWRRRCGGDLIHHYPAVLSAKIGLDKHLPAMKVYVQQTQKIVSWFCQYPCFRLIPENPRANLFHLQIDLPKTPVLEILSDYSREQQLVILPPPRNQENEFCRFEITIGDSCQQLDDARWTGAIAALASKLKQLQETLS